MLVSGLTACKKTPQKFSAYSFDYFDTQTVITGYADSREAFDAVADQYWTSWGNIIGSTPFTSGMRGRKIFAR